MKLVVDREIDSGCDIKNVEHDTTEHSLRPLSENVVSLYLLLGVYYLVPLAVLPYLVRTLGIEMYGLVAYSQSFAQYFTIFTDYGFNFSATRSIAQRRNDHAIVSEIFCSVYLIKIVLTFLGVIVLALFLVFVPKLRGEAPFFAMAYLAVVGNVLFPTWYYQGVESMRYISVIVGTARITAALMLFIFVHRPQDALLAVIIQSAGSVLAGAIGLGIALIKYHPTLRWPQFGTIRETLAEGWHLFLSSAAIGLYTNTNVFLVGTLAGNAEAAYFSAAEKLLRGMQALIGPAIQASFPHVSKLRTESDQRALAFMGKSVRWICGLTLIPSAVMLFAAKPVTFLCFGHQAIGTVSVVRWIALLPVLSSISNVLGVNTMIPFGMDRQFSKIVITAGLMNILLACFLIPHWGADGAGASILTAEVIVVSGIVFALQRGGIAPFGRRSLAL